MAAFGDIVTAAGGSYTGKPRPVLIVQNPAFRTGGSVIVIPFTSVHNPGVDTRIPVPPSQENGLDRPCYLEADKVSAIRGDWLGAVIGHLEEDLLTRVLDMVHALTSPCDRTAV